MIYHHFPGGKDELALEALQSFGAGVAAGIEGLPRGDDSLGAVIAAFLDQVRPVVGQAVDGAGCAVAAVATETPAGTPLHDAAGAMLAHWRVLLADQLHATGATRPEAERIAALLLMLLQGAQVLCRAEGSLQPFDDAVSAFWASAWTAER